jgi:Restriction endonuclease BglII
MPGCTTNREIVETDRFLPEEITRLYEVHQWRHAIPLLATVHPEQWKDILDVLGAFRLRKSALVKGGGNKTKDIAGAIDEALYKRGWVEKMFDTAILVDTERYDSPTHKVDCFKNRVALELEWNNKDPFFDRDLNNFRLLYDLRVVDVGIVITRCDELQKLVKSLGRGASFGASTTHMSKLLPKIEGGGAGGCPVAVFGIRTALYDPSN